MSTGTHKSSATLLTRRRYVNVRLCLALGLGFLATTSVRARTIPFTPVTWSALTPGDTLSFPNGQLVVEELGYRAGAYVEGFTARNLGVEAQFQILSGSQAGVFLRSNVEDLENYFGNIRTSSHPNYPEMADIWRHNSPDSGTPLTEFKEVDFDPDGVVVMRLQAIDDNLSLWVWQAGTERPQEPFLTAQDATWTDGTVGVWVIDYPANQHARIAVDYFEVTVFGDGDYNANGLVEQADLDLALLNWGQSWPRPLPTWLHDQPTDGWIDQDDLDRVLLNWGNSSTSVGVVPEPTSVMLLLAGIGIAYLRGHRVLNRVGR